jgi:SpoIID/LytB domain protein
VATQNGTVRRGYRGTITARRIGSASLQVINNVRMEQYLRSVVPAEVSPSWPTESLKAQAVAARSYAARESMGRADRSFDVYDSTRSQAYRGAVSYTATWQVLLQREHPRTDEAIAATAGVHVTVGGAAVLTQFGASNGGATAASPLPHMVVAADAWDARATRNPRLSWTRSVSASDLGRRYGLGTLTAIEVLGREGQGPWGGRVTAVRLVGPSGSRVLTGDGAIRSGLGVFSSMLTFAPPA